MLGQHGRGLTKALLTRPALAMARVGITPNMLTVVGTVLSVGVAVATFLRGVSSWVRPCSGLFS